MGRAVRTTIFRLAVVVSLGACGSPAATKPPADAPQKVTAPMISRPTNLPPPPYGTAEKLGAWLDAYAAGYGSEWGPAYEPNGYVVIARGGVPVVARAYGKANPRTGAPADESTRFRIGSLTKQFTAVAILKLDEDKKLSLTDDVRKWVPALPPSFGGITLSHLLTQTTGIASYTQDEALMSARNEPATPGRVLATFTNKPLAFKPGAKFEYSNSNYFLLGLVVERASGVTFERYLQANVLGPAGLTRTSTVDDPGAPDTAVGMTTDSEDNVTEAKPIDMSIPFAAGALRSTAHDLLSWDAALSAHALIDAAHETIRTTPAKDGYACGVLIGEKHGQTVEQHNGGIDGFSSSLARVPALGITVVVLMSSESFATDTFASAVLSMTLEGKPVRPHKERKVMPYDHTIADHLAGDYAISDASKVMLTPMLPKAVLDSVLTTAIVDDGKRVRMKPVGQGTFTLFLGENGVFFTKQSAIEVTPDKDDQGRIPGFGLKQGGLAIDYVRH